MNLESKAIRVTNIHWVQNEFLADHLSTTFQPLTRVHAMKLRWRSLSGLTTGQSWAQSASDTTKQRSGQRPDARHEPKGVRSHNPTSSISSENRAVEAKSKDAGIGINQKKIRIELSADVLFDADKSTL
jgi:outer membrane protein OmpA-like peptidoglycan-associated protein